MRRRTLNCFWLSCFIMLFWCPVFGRIRMNQKAENLTLDKAFKTTYADLLRDKLAWSQRTHRLCYELRLKADVKIRKLKFSKARVLRINTHKLLRPRDTVSFKANCPLVIYIIILLHVSLSKHPPEERLHLNAKHVHSVYNFAN